MGEAIFETDVSDVNEPGFSRVFTRQENVTGYSVENVVREPCDH